MGKLICQNLGGRVPSLPPPHTHTSYIPAHNKPDFLTTIESVSKIEEICNKLHRKFVSKSDLFRQAVTHFSNGSEHGLRTHKC